MNIKKIFIFFFVVSLIALAGCDKPEETPEPPANASISYSCSVSQGFNFLKDAQDRVGHLVSIKIVDNELTPDLNVADPEDLYNNVKVVGVISSLYWGGGYADFIQLSAQVSTSNKNALAMMMHQTMSNTEVELEFVVFDYDPDAKKYYKCLHTNKVKLKGLVAKSGGELAFNVGMDQSQEVTSPRNFTFQIVINPQEISQELHLAFSESAKSVKKWGIK